MDTIFRFFLMATAFAVCSCCGNTSKTEASVTEPDSAAVEVKCDTLLTKTTTTVNSVPFIIFEGAPERTTVAFTAFIMPSEADSTVLLCVEGAFTGREINYFESTNIAGDYVIAGGLHRGYNCPANTGFLASVDGKVTIAAKAEISEWIEKTQKSGGYLFQQILLVQGGQPVYTGTPIPPTKENFYRAACIMKDGNFAVIQSEKPLPLGDFISYLVRIGASDAIYLDMGGWNYGWYRQTMDSEATKLFDVNKLQTNWLLIKAKL